ncbi:hypothetical protein Strain138_002141 [Pseudogemmatithrix spongiicola]|uniref:Lipoprotein n=1 Tax=Pseudogemmatithrix spongiicola TaxID=3062599 RepID=A0AA49JVN1_9BACT|nr:hypothetical protein Strain138_002141 [Gemmatimonadaceae bacterium 'strain 138']WKW15738.1 hypothetical protein Strain318_002140 [Gemmatimonadaceae bacterium 'strain 318']
MTGFSRIVAALLVAVLVGCDRGAAPEASTPDAGSSPSTSAPSAVPDSLQIDVAQLTLIGFHPFATDSMLERDEALATILDDFGYHLSGAMTALRDSGWVVDTRIADTLHFRSSGRTWTWIRPADSVNVGYILTDSTGRIRTLFGVRTNIDLVIVADSFARGSRR